MLAVAWHGGGTNKRGKTHIKNVLAETFFYSFPYKETWSQLLVTEKSSSLFLENFTFNDSVVGLNYKYFGHCNIRSSLRGGTFTRQHDK